MGACCGTSRSSIENIIHDIWADCDLTKMNPKKYVSLYEQLVNDKKDILNMGDHDENVY